MNIIVFAGPNGSGKSTTIDKFVSMNNLENVPFINADNIANLLFSHIEDYNTRNLAAAKYAEAKRHELLENGESFIFETVLSTERNINFLKLAKEKGAKIYGVYVLTRDPSINVERVKLRVKSGGHGVPEDKIVSRYHRCLTLLPEFIDVSDQMMLFDNSTDPHLVMVKANDKIKVISNQVQDKQWFIDNVLISLKKTNNVSRFGKY